MSWISAGLKKVRKTLHLPPVTLKNVATKYAPVALTVASLGGAGPLAGVAGKIGSVASKLPGAAKIAGLAKGAGTLYNTLSGSSGSTPEPDGGYGGYDGYDESSIGDASVNNSSGLGDILSNIRKSAGLPPITLKNTLGGLTGAIGGALKTALDNPLETIGGIAAAKSGADAMKRGQDLSNKAIATREQSYSERAPLRTRGVAGMLKDTTIPKQDFVNLANPFSKRRLS